MNIIPLSAAGSLPKPSREQLMESIQRTQALVDEWQPEVKADLESCVKWKQDVQFNHKLAGWGIKGAIAGGVMVAVGLGISMALGHGNLGVWPGMATFIAGITVSQVGVMRRDNASMNYQMKYSPALHRQELLDTRLYPRLAEAKAALLEQDTAEMQRLADGLQQMGNIMERPDAVLVGGTLLRKR